LEKNVLSKLIKNTVHDGNLIFDVNKLVDELLRCECMMERHKNYITGGKSEMEKSHRLVEVLTRRSLVDYKVFVNCLMKQQAPLAALLSIDNKGEIEQSLIYI